MKRLLSFFAILVLSLAVVCSVTACDIADLDDIGDKIEDIGGGINDALGDIGGGNKDDDKPKECKHISTVIVSENYIEATCTENGSYYSVEYCNKCEKELSRVLETVPATGHTCDGINDNVCSTCGEVISSEGLVYTLNPGGKSYTVTGIGSFTGNDLFIGTYNGLPVTSIGSYAFYDCTGLTSVTIGNSVTSIVDSAFCYCSGLTSVTIGNGVTSIGYRAFYDCTGLTSITIPESVTSISASAFYYCTGLTSIIVDANNQSYKSVDGNLYTKDGKTLVQYAIGKSETSFTIPNGVTRIDDSAFSYCSGLTSITIPGSVTSIGDWAFSDCSGLTSITIPDSVTSIGDWAFSDCYNLRSITIPDRVTSIGYRAFYYCSSLTSITIPDSVTSIGEEAFYYCYRLTSVTIGNSVTSIGASAFYNCYGLTSITIPDSVTSIGEDAFWDCYNLTSVTIGNGVTSIGEGAFLDCYRLTSVTIGNGVTSIGDYAFYYCYELTSIKYRGTEAEWNAITKGDDWDYNAGSDIGGYTITYNYVESSPGLKYTLNYDGKSYTVTGIGTFTGKDLVIGYYNGLPVTAIGDYAFYDCYGLTSVTIGNSVTSIGSSAFYSCYGLTSIKYRGTEEQWNAITKGSGWDTYTGYNVGSYTITYNYTGN